MKENFKLFSNEAMNPGPSCGSKKVSNGFNRRPYESSDVAGNVRFFAKEIGAKSI